jgi:hypothetical protein
MKMGPDAKKFLQIDLVWKEVMKQAHSNPSVMKFVQGYN